MVEALVFEIAIFQRILNHVYMAYGLLLVSPSRVLNVKMSVKLEL